MAKSPPPPNLESLVDLACRNGVDIRPTLLRVLTDLYVQKPSHSAAEEAQYVELAQRLIEVTDAVTRATITARLASYAGAPAPILQMLAKLTARRPGHQSVYWDDERMGARMAATPSHARTARRNDSLASRLRNSGR